jgi:hypothetical protein
MNYLSVNIEKLLAWSVAFFAYLEANMTTWNVSSTWVSEVKSKLTDLQNAYAVWANPATKTKAAHTDMETKRQIFAKAVEPLVQNLRSLPALTPEDYDLLQIAPPYTGSHRKKPQPKTWPVLTIKVHGQGVVELLYHDSDTPSSTAKPSEAAEVVIRMGFSEAIPASAEELKDMIITITRTPHHLTLPAERVGQKLHAAGAWVNPTGERGPWGPVVSAVVS